MAGSIRLNTEDFTAAIPFGFAMDSDGVLTCVGDALQRRLGMQPGQHVDDVVTVARPPRKKSFRELPVDPSATVVLRARDGEIELKGMTIALDDGDRIGFLGTAIVTDVEEFRRRDLLISDFPPSDATPDLLLSMQATRTALQDARKLSADLEVALVKARSATEAKARFLAIMSHEIRTPLNGFGSMIDLLRDSGLDAEKLEHLDTMDLCARSLLVLVNDILDFSKLEAGRVELHRSPVELGGALRRMTGHFEAAARERGLELEVGIDVDGARWVEIDYERVRQVVANLLGNALKFTLEGGITVAASAPAPGVVCIDVQDSGVGIPKEDRDGLFDPFVQADNSATRRFGGTGLGLTISRQLAEAMGGTVELIDSSDNGTHFRFTFDAPQCEAPKTSGDGPDAADDAQGFAHAAVLIAEDDKTNQLIVKKMLQKLNVTPTIVDDGVQAMLEANKNRYDLILMDVMMPNMNGIEATQRIRSSEGPCSEVPIIAFSAAAFDTDRDNAKAAGMNDFIEKPARVATLREILRRYAPRQAT
ncbi:MAG: response regulator [Planctomycetes bacterium]|nr:response regulator [Planctomycetota bacterium]